MGYDTPSTRRTALTKVSSKAAQPYSSRFVSELVSTQIVQTRHITESISVSTSRPEAALEQSHVITDRQIKAAAY